MSKKLVLGLLLVMAFCFVQIVPAMAADQAKTATPAKTEKHSMSNMHHAAHPANVVAVCACGKVFHPDANTKFVEYNGKQYACCSDKCHEMGMKDPAGAAKMAEENTEKMMSGTAAPATTSQK